MNAFHRQLREDGQAGQPYQFQVKINSRDTPQGLLIQPEVVPSQHSAPLPAGKACTAKANNSSNHGALTHCPYRFSLLLGAIWEHNYSEWAPARGNSSRHSWHFVSKAGWRNISCIYKKIICRHTAPRSPPPNPHPWWQNNQPDYH